ncbi:HNH endonuclease family protein [Sphingobacterium puteale]|uniref:HNH endonuclease domain-containing protein n=1 Tax=Sphingobacterium puteale TaxID=2420510 RepID=UPI0016027477|nr:HNH endonuclease domain-containing protein [Sphingobacterium puteale]
MHEDIRRLIKQNIDCILTGEVGQLVEFYETNSSLLNENSLEIENFFVNSAYKNFFQTNCAEEFLNLLNKNTCIYCNRNYTLAIVKGRTRAEIDHWLPKTHFPIFAVSFYNLIPSCHSCNHLKGAGEDAEWWVKNHKEIANPYSDKGTFDFNYTFSKSKNEFEITFENVSNPKIRRMIKENRLREIYSAHREFELRDLHELRLKYPDNYLKDLLAKTFSTSISEEEKYRLIFGIDKNEENFHKRPLSKFKNDIIKKLLSL